MAVSAPTIRLNNGQVMPMIGLGTWRSKDSNAAQAVKDAIDVGYRHIDTAFLYENEHEVGEGIATKIAESIVTREELFVVTKLGHIHHEPHLVEHACRLSLKKLGLDYIDQFLVHNPVGQVYNRDEQVQNVENLSDVDYLDTWHAMEKLVDLGLVRGIGLSNFNSEQTERVLQNCRIKPVVNQVECHPCFNQKKLISFSKEREIIITGFCPLARPQPDNHWPPFLYDDAAKKLAQKYGKTTAQISLRYIIQLGAVPIPKSVSKNRIAENFNVFDFELSDEDMKIMDAYQTGVRVVPFVALREHKYFPFNIEF